MSTERRWKILGFLYLAVFCLILWLAYQGQLPGYLTANDKAAHVILYGIATFVGHRVLNFRLIYRRIPLFPLLFGIFTVAEEFAQSLSPNRTFDFGDLIASFAGIAIGWWLCERSRSRE
jgi:VanZ family protein